jgi:protein-S-isoprenylcysteine O-methyltransferase Ste14
MLPARIGSITALRMEPPDIPNRSAFWFPAWIWTPALTAGALVFSLAYVALAVIGWGRHDWRGFFDSPCRAGVCVGMVVLFVGTFILGCNVCIGRRDDPGNNWIFLPMLLVGLMMGWLPAYQDRRHIWMIGGNGVAYAGLLLFGLGTIFRLGAVRTLGPRHSVWVAVQETHGLVTSGLYRFIRHPSYVGALLAVFGWALAFRSIAGLLLGVCMVPPILSRIKAEELLLAAEFGEEYREYQLRTWRLVPWIF